MKIDLNGSIIEESQAVVSVYDHGFLYGLGLFETFRTYEGRPFLLEEHLERLAAGCRSLEMAYEPDAAALEERILRLLEANGLSDAYFRLTVTAGIEQLGLPAGAYRKPQEVLYIKALPQADPAVYQQGRALQLLELRRNSPEGPLRLKSLHYMNNILAKQELRRYAWAGQSEGLFLDRDGFICEGIVSNIFWVKEGRLCTPSVDTGLLPGITRAYVLQLAREGLQLPAVEGRFTLEALQQADEVFITNSIQELVPITKFFDGSGRALSFSGGRIGRLTERLLGLYRESTRTKGGTA